MKVNLEVNGAELELLRQALERFPTNVAVEAGSGDRATVEDLLKRLEDVKALAKMKPEPETFDDEVDGISPLATGSVPATNLHREETPSGSYKTGHTEPCCICGRTMWEWQTERSGKILLDAEGRYHVTDGSCAPPRAK